MRCRPTAHRFACRVRLQLDYQNDPVALLPQALNQPQQARERQASLARYPGLRVAQANHAGNLPGPRHDPPLGTGRNATTN